MTVIVPELMILYWFPPSVLDSTCTGLVAVVVAEMTTVLPQGENGADTDIIYLPKFLLIHPKYIFYRLWALVLEVSKHYQLKSKMDMAVER